MITADWVILGIAAFFCLSGLFAGFGRGLKFFTSGIFGFIISVLVCYCLGGFIYNLTFVRELLDKFLNVLSNKNGFCDFLINIHIDIIVYYVALFIVVTIIRIIIVAIIKNVAELNNGVLKLINRILGLIFFVAVFALLLLIVFHIIELIGGSTAEGFLAKLSGSAIKLDYIFEHNPLMSIINSLKM